MNNKANNTNPVERKARTMALLRKIWTGLILVFVVVIVLNLYNYTQGKGDLRGILSPLAMIFVGLATIVSTRNRGLYYALMALALIFVTAALIILIFF